MTSAYSINLNPNITTPVKTGYTFKSGDKGITFNIAVTEMDPTGTSAKIAFHRANGTSVEAALSGQGPTYSYTILGNEFAVPGVVVADVKFYQSTTQRVSTASFVFNVINDTLDGLGGGTAGYSDELETLSAAMEGYIEAFGNLSPINPRGAYNASTAYEPADCVSYNGNSWLCIQPCTGVTPSEGAYWQQVADTATGKADKVNGAITGNLAGLDSTGNLTDSGVSPVLQQHSCGGAVSSVGWYRFAKTTMANAALGSFPWSKIIKIVKGFSSNGSSTHIITVARVFNKTIFSSIIEKQDENSNLSIDKIRYSYNSSLQEGYLDFHYALSTANSINIFVDDNEYIAVLNSFESVSDSPSGEIIEEYLFSKDYRTTNIKTIAPTEDGTTASRAYAAGESFYRFGSFCKCILAIASGGTFTLNSNYIETTVAEQLSPLYTTYDTTFTTVSGSSTSVNISVPKGGIFLICLSITHLQSSANKGYSSSWTTGNGLIGSTGAWIDSTNKLVGTGATFTALFNTIDAAQTCKVTTWAIAAIDCALTGYAIRIA